MPVRTALLGVLPPLIIAAVFLLIGWRPWRKTRGTPAHWASAFALALAYAATDSLVAARWPGFPPTESHRWLPYLALIAAAVSAISPSILIPSRGSARWPIYLLCALCFALLLRHDLATPATRLGALLRLFLYTIAATIIQPGIAGASAPGTPFPPQPHASRAASIRIPLTLLIAATGAAVAFVQAHSAFFAQMAGAIAAVMGVFLLLALWKPALDISRGMSAVFAILLVGLVLCLHTTSLSALCVLAAAASPALATTPIAGRLRPWQTTLLCAAAAAGCTLVAVWQSPGGFDFSPE